MIIFNTQESMAVKGPYDKEWSQVEAFEKKGLWKSALEKTLEIEKMAKSQKQDAESLKALLYRVRYSERLVEFSESSNLDLLEKELKLAVFPQDAMLRSLLAQAYQGYLSNNRWDLLQQVSVSQKADMPIEEWSIKQLEQRIFDLCREAINESNKLQQINISQWTALVNPGINTSEIRPTLFDLLAHRSIAILHDLSEEGTGVASGNYFNKPVYLSSFRAYMKQDTDKSELTTSMYAFMHDVYIQLIRFHEKSNNAAALIDVDLDRLRWVYSASKLADREQLYLSSLGSLRDAYSQSSYAAEAVVAIAEYLVEQGLQYRAYQNEDKRWYLKRAKEMLDAALLSYSKSPAETRMRRLVDQIMSKDLSLEAEEAMLPNTWFKVLLKYRNTDKVYLRIIANGRKDDQIAEGRSAGSDMDSYMKASVLREWVVELPVDGDFQSHSVELPIKGLEAGEYILLASASSKFETTGNGIAVVELNSSILSYTSRNMPDGRLEVMTLHRGTGRPLRKVDVDSYYLVYDSNARAYKSVRSNSYITDNDGFLFLSNLENGKNFYLVIRKDKSKLRTATMSTYGYSKGKKEIEERHWYFTDRAIYRPGQTLFFKMIVEEDTAVGHKVLAEKKVIIYLRDANNTKIDSLELSTNAFGSVNASFKLPSSSLNGEFSLSSEFGQTGLWVESYKRPAFEVTADKLKGIVELNKPMTVDLKASTYSGLPMGAATFTWELGRRESFGMFWYGGRIADPFGNTNILNSGNGITKEDGSFEISFTPWSESSIVDEGDNYMFELLVHVTDGSGETHNLNKGYIITKSGVNKDILIDNRVNKDKPFAFELSLSNAEGSQINASGDLRIVRLSTPTVILKERLWDRPDKFIMTAQDHKNVFLNDLFDNEDDARGFPQAESVWEGQFNTRITNQILPGLQKSKLGADVSSWPSGSYRITASGKSEDGRELMWDKMFTVYSAKERELPVKSYLWTELMTPEVGVGDTAVFLVGTSDLDAQIYCEITCKGESINRKWILLNQEQRKVEIPVDHSMKGGFFITLFMVKQNRFFKDYLDIMVPYSDKLLDIEWTTFRDKIEPGKQETINLNIKGLGENETAEILASMYDASLDAYTPHFWNLSLYPANVGKLVWNGSDGFEKRRSYLFQLDWNKPYIPKNPDLPKVYPDIPAAQFLGNGGMLVLNNMSESAPMEGARMKNATLGFASDEQSGSQSGGETTSADLGLRSNLQETAFFFPSLLTDKKGNVSFQFTAPDAISKWKFMTLAHSKELRFGMKNYVLQTQKKLVVKPNLPRFLRQGDKITITARVSSVIDSTFLGTVVLSLRNPQSGELIDKQFGNIQNSKPFKLIGIETRVISWDITVPEGFDGVNVRIMATAGKLSDGEESYLPVLANRELLMDAYRFYSSEEGSKTFVFDAMNNLIKNGSTAKAVSLNIEFDANPLWNVVKALPYLMEYPYNCLEQEYSRFFANALGSKILQDNPGMAVLMKAWMDEGNLSEFDKNPELRTNTLENSPWVYAAESERKQRARLALLMDVKKINDEKEAIAKKLIDNQLSNGGWSWFPGMADNEFITTHLLTGLARMNDLGLLNSMNRKADLLQAMDRAMEYLDERMAVRWRKIKKAKTEWNIGSTEINYLYSKALMRHAQDKSEAWLELIKACKKNWTTYDMDLQARLGSAFVLLGMQNEADAILASLRETSIQSDELGTFWKHVDGNRMQGNAITENQAFIIQFFLDMGVQGMEIAEMRKRLLMDKQVNAWESTKATTEACFVMLDKNPAINADPNETKLLVGGVQVKPDAKAAVTGYLSKSWTASEIASSMAKIEVQKTKEGLSWGAAYFQYTEDLDKAAAGNSGMKLMRVILKEKSQGVWEEFTLGSESKPGEKLKIRLIMTLDRDMEFLHLKDLRASGLEPGVVLSGYRWDNGLGYYRNISDVSMDFFFDWLPSGTHILEYDLYAAYSGDFSNGFSEIESMYAPAFRARTVGGRIKLK